MPKERNAVAKSFAFVQRERAVARREEETWGCDYGEALRQRILTPNSNPDP